MFPSRHPDSRRAREAGRGRRILCEMAVVAAVVISWDPPANAQPAGSGSPTQPRTPTALRDPNEGLGIAKQTPTSRLNSRLELRLDSRIRSRLERTSIRSGTTGDAVAIATRRAQESAERAAQLVTDIPN